MSEMRLSVTVPGKPRGQGSMALWTDKDGKERAKYGDRVVEHRNLVVGMLRADWAGAPALDEPVAVRVSASFARPAGHYLPANTRRPEPVLRDNAPDYWTGYPDSDKILRLVNDALKIAGVIRDDSLVVIGRTEKLFNQANETNIEVWALGSNLSVTRSSDEDPEGVTPPRPSDRPHPGV